MKISKIIFSVCLLSCFTMSIFGQAEQGDVLFGGESKIDFSFINSKWKSDDGDGDRYKTFSFEFSPQVGFFLFKGFALGFELPIGLSSQIEENDDKYTTTSLAFAPFIRYYFGSSNVKPYLHSQIGFGYQKTKFETDLGSNEYPGTLLLWGESIGLGIFFNDNVSLDIGLKYAYRSYKATENNDTNRKNLYRGIEFGIGFVVIL